ncbi:VOC family protein [Mesorhizobium sp. LHD-90]|uniref:VOC family protein n=1 Tax=Mesorhizobium sp. LHD-90 TaxID=3071414 RepID=UPI0027E04026|nr:VOC family protein [Mesorhizobium sp. LHD-90]MDQ6436931.1 VOC family protein [Mesorhizobium sp. LHD-90]
MEEQAMPASRFFWYELLTDDPASAAKFYKAVVGWGSENWGDPQDPYIIVKVGETGVGGIMRMPPEAKAMGTPPCWVGYIHVKDVDAATAKIKAAGGAIHREPADIPEIGRFSVVADPQGATFMLMAPQGPDQEPLPADTPGAVGWRELYTTDWKAALDFYAGQFGWTADEAMDMGPMGTYQLFTAGAERSGGMMNKPANIPMPLWQFYFTVERLDAAAERVKANGGQVLMEPMQVPGGSWIAPCLDPEGAVFSLTARER